MTPTILFVSPLPPPHGGIATWTKKLFDHGLPDGSRLALVNTKICGNRNIFDKAVFSFTELFRSLAIYRSLVWQLLIKRPKLMHLNSSLSSWGIFRDLSCVILAKICQVPTVTHYHGNVPDFKGNKVSHFALRCLLNLSSTNIVTNQSSLTHVKNIYLVNKPKKIFLLPNFIEDKMFTQALASNKHGRQCRAIFVGGITKAKGGLEILAAAKSCPEIEFHLYGKMHDDMNKYYLALPNNLYLHGEKNHSVIMQAMRHSDFLFFPSHSEGFPLTVLEAMTHGLPVIATAVGAIPEMIEHGQGGFLLSPHDTAGLLSAIKKLSSDSELRRTLGQYNRDKSHHHYRYSVVITELLKIYNQITGSHSCVA